MSIFQDRQNRSCLLFLSVFCASLVILSVLAIRLQLQYTVSILQKNEVSIASSLLEQGVSKEILAAAFSEETVTDQGALFLRQIGHQNPASLWLLPVVRQSAGRLMLLFLCVSLALGMLLLFGSICLMRKREDLYEKAADTVRHFAKGDFSSHLPGTDAGTVYRLFASIDQLAMALQTKSEAEHKAREFLKDTISDISHQLKTPLAALHMYTEIIYAEPENRETVKRFSEKSLQSLTRMEELIQSLLKMVRLDAGSICFEKRIYRVTELIERALQNLEFRAEQEHKQMLLCGDEKEQIYCDMEWTGEALGNLIKNALDHTTEGSSIRISWERAPAMLRLTVTDFGCGIAPEDIHHIFKRFYRGSHSGKQQGVGLGLPLARGIVEGQGGILSVDSSPNEGTRFSISFLTES